MTKDGEKGMLTKQENTIFQGLNKNIRSLLIQLKLVTLSWKDWIINLFV